MKLPQEEQNVLNILLEANGQPLRAKAIAEQLGIQDNHCNKLIKFLRDKGWWIQRELVKINGITKKYKHHWIDPKAHIKPLNEPEPSHTQRQGLYQVDSPCLSCGSYYERNGECNQILTHK